MLVDGMRVELRIPDRDLVESWGLDVEVTDDNADVVIFDPREVGRPDAPSIGWLDCAVDPSGLLHPGATQMYRRRADAYAGDRDGLRSALDWLLAGRPLPNDPSLVYLGGLGTTAAHGIRVGTAVPLTNPCTVGRSQSNDLVLRQGAHSDQNIVARRHASVSFQIGGPRLHDCGSTNGTYIDRGRISCRTTIVSGEEFAIASCFRVLLV